MLYTSRRTGTRLRHGFTAVEMIVVVTIILVLVSLSAGAIIKVLLYQQRRTTEQTVSKVSMAFNQHWKAVIDAAKTEQINPIAGYLANGDERRARVIHILMCLRRDFPMTFVQATLPVSMKDSQGNLLTFGPNPAYVTALQGVNQANYNGEQQSSACLYLALKQRRMGSNFDPDTGLSSQEVVDVGGIKLIADSWGQPIVLNRWPAANGYGSPLLNPGGPQNFNPSAPADSQDPEGLLANSGWLNWVQKNNYFYVTNQVNYLLCVDYPLGGAGQQYKLTPVIMSLGQNGKDDGNSSGSDDILNLQLP
jgi:prepilin-type N-terminal cleavage/methylation domain-containing protein